MSEKKIFYDIYDFIHVPFWKTTTFLIIISCLIALLIGIAAYFFIRYKKRKALLSKILTPSEWAILELEKLSPQDCETKEDFKKLYFDLTSIFKNYLEKKFANQGWNVIEKTDEELIIYIKEKGLEKDFIEKLQTVLQGSLLIKFANAEALRGQAQKDISTITLLISFQTPQEL